MNDTDQTVQEAETTIARMGALLGEAASILHRSETEIGAARQVTSQYVERLPAEKRAEIDREIQALSAEIERDLPRELATRRTRVKPTRQMV